ncbi:ATP-binding cassette subfamily C protein [Bradyrhizobium huanghuaihaiense]|uniref:ATP-binding cassette subfamily C protein/ATP-binding cassette subfamily C exporter for protease/lipase/ATP-binding cassette subfamily C protein EexD n=1 Tax=Bradyrhizobium huanghuaihaiense TaxID=990078 RepID=A0A562QTT3_9BRAD|nr:type I secretion system permease/ATPase [Bradyrhizobium huanghuaihaiense]TWI60182.1 ATP-binding cassette subfamily C protein/ATP-binding cassette subfamily C exporter for protease/lipase/ATP-binding cassette subfamily C protein EexD [Bradyrhizobium huanghuaihaiense]
MSAPFKRPDELRRLLQTCQGYFATAGIFSLAINLLYLAGPLYMLQVYDRVISSASEITLLMLTIALLLAFMALAGLDAVRARVLTRASIRLDREIASRVMTAIIDRSANAGGARSQAIRDFDTFRQFVTGTGIHAIFDLPWAPIYIVVIFALHPFLGAFALGCSVILVLMALLSEWLVKLPLTESNEAAARSYSFTEMSLRNTEVVRAMGMTGGLLRRWSRDRDRMLERQVAASDRAAAIQSLIRFLRLAMQSLILGLGAYLVIERVTTVGSMFAASILLGRALQPVEQIVGSWRGLVSARAAFLRIRELLTAHPVLEAGLTLPRPKGHVSVEALTFVPQGGARPILRGVTFAVEAGEVLGVIGPSGAGKSTLSRQLVGVLTPSAGAVRLDGADVATWVKRAIGDHVGYLPQDIELFSDTIAANIGRFDEGSDKDVILAAQLAGVHEMILRLPHGYDTQVGEGGAILSGGFRQRIGLARAVYGGPSLVVLDEPSSNLDAEGDVALADCIVQLKKGGTTVVIVSHRPATIGVVDKILVLREGVAEMFGARAEIMARLTRPVPVHAVQGSSS